MTLKGHCTTELINDQLNLDTGSTLNMTLRVRKSTVWNNESNIVIAVFFYSIVLHIMVCVPVLKLHVVPETILVKM